MKTILRSQQLSCPTCVAKIERALGAREGVKVAKVYFATGRIEIEHDPERIGPDDLVKAVRSAGYEARIAAF